MADLEYNGGGVSGYMFDSTNTELVTLFTNLGIKSLRIGGTSVDKNTGIANFPQYTPTNQDIDALFRFANAAGVKVVLSLRLENGNPSLDASIAGYTWSNYNQYLTCFAIGNEPDAYNNNNGYPAIANFSSYLATWASFAATITNAVPAAKFGGPDSEGTSWAASFANAEIGSSIVTWIFSHDYVGGSSSGLTAQQVIAGMLSSSWDTSNYPSQYNATEAVAQADGFPYRLTEFNSYVCDPPGVWGGNNSFASALFAVDSAHWWAAHNCNGVNFHTLLGKYNGTVYYDANGNYQIYPIGYGMKAYDVGGHGSVMPLAITNTSGLNLTAYAMGNNTNLYVTIVNKENGAGARNASVSILPQGFVTGSVQAMFLSAINGVGATNGITLGGAFITNNAPWLGQWTTLSPLNNGQCVLTVSNSSAAIVKIQAATLFAPPVIVANLPAQVRLAAGRSYQYSVTVTGGLPMSYQWYQNASPVAGVTNASYLVTAGAVGSTANYSVVATNIYGAVTSVVSTVTVISIPLLTDFYGRQVLSYGPVGYWPLQETNAPVPGNWETNYGTLGKLGNAYYACTNSSEVSFDQPGALAGTADPCVGLSGSSANPNSYAFVPRLTPALTIQAPFTLEAWVNMANTGYGVEIGEGGGTGLNGGANLGGFQMGQGPQTAGLQFQMNYYTGSGSSQNDEQETTLLYTAGEWYHYVVTYDGANSILYVNGRAIFTATSPNAPDTWSPLCIGAGKWGGVDPIRWFDGSLDEVAIYTNVLSELQVTNHFLAGIRPS
ncbi:MAG: LamG-like jellyroll fold domain-containing protein [Limisphaerales bacterium]